MTRDSSGNLYGTANAGGANSDGTVFELSPDGVASAPEPGSLILLTAAALPLLGSAARRRRRR